jgi:hypothetical protein
VYVQLSLISENGKASCEVVLPGIVVALCSRIAEINLAISQRSIAQKGRVAPYDQQVGEYDRVSDVSRRLI